MFWFFSSPVSAKEARALGAAVTERHEVLPNESTAFDFIAGPLGVEPASGERSVFLGDNFEEVADSRNLLQKAELVEINKYLHLFQPCRQRQAQMFQPPVSEGTLRPCLELALRNGASGFVHETGHLICVELRRLHCSKTQAAGVLACWNLRCKPRLSRDELGLVLNGAYSGTMYAYGCSPEGHLRRVLDCLGERCPLYVREEIRRESGVNCHDRASEGKGTANNAAEETDKESQLAEDGV
jgi:hypothetical protein